MIFNLHGAAAAAVISAIVVLWAITIAYAIVIFVRLLGMR